MTQGSNTKPTPNMREIIKNGLILGCTACISLGLVFTVGHFTVAKIKADKIRQENARYAKLLPAGSFNNALGQDCRFLTLSDGRKVRILTARKDDKVTGYIASYEISGGYAVPFSMTAGITVPEFSIYYVDIDVFNETPGLGDKVLRSKSSFLDSFNGANSKNRTWEVKKYGGDFDYFTGATVTPRAVVRSTGTVLSALNERGVAGIEALPLCASNNKTKSQAKSETSTASNARTSNHEE